MSLLDKVEVPSRGRQRAPTWGSLGTRQSPHHPINPLPSAKPPNTTPSTSPGVLVRPREERSPHHPLFLS